MADGRATSNRVWIIADSVRWEGDHVHSVYATRESALQAIKSLPEPAGEWIILEYVVRP